jgi:mannose-6-phosphate isomerase-like protein (cupin superfamily)
MKDSRTTSLMPQEGRDRMNNETEHPAVLLDRQQFFTTIGAPLLAKGQSIAKLASAEHLWVHLKIYHEGGENELHHHATEDHMFFGLGGRGVVYDEHGGEREIRPFEGVMIPAGVNYRLLAVGDENWVTLRIGASALGGGSAPGEVNPTSLDRHNPDGSLSRSKGEDWRLTPRAGIGEPSGEVFDPFGALRKS